MAWCHKATTHHRSKWWPRFMSPYGVTRPQWLKLTHNAVCLYCSFFIWYVMYICIYSGVMWLKCQCQILYVARIMRFCTRFAIHYFCLGPVPLLTKRTDVLPQYFETARYVFTLLQLLWNLAGTSIDTIIDTSTSVASRLHAILRWDIRPFSE